jgi:hypothetical protein
MSDKPITEKLHIKPGQRVALLNVPQGYDELLDDLPEGVEIVEVLEGEFDLIVVFATYKHEVETQALNYKTALRPNGALWVCFPKMTSKLPKDMNRDSLNATLAPYGFEGIATISVDDDWSGLRFKMV